MYLTQNDKWLVIDRFSVVPQAVAVSMPQVGKLLLQHEKWAHLVIGYNLMSKETGYDILLWAIVNGITPKHVMLMTELEPALVRMQGLLSGAGYVSKNGVSWTYTKAAFLLQ